MVKRRLALFQCRMNNAIAKLLRRGDSGIVAAFGASLYENVGLRYDMPDHARAEESSRW